MIKSRLCNMGLSVVLAACTTMDASWLATEQIPKGWQARPFDDAPLWIAAWQKPSAQHSSVMRIYIEGDGFAWATQTQPSTDPTPKQAVAMQLAQLESGQNVIYLARPCQFSARKSPACDDNRWWTQARFSRPVIARYHQILNQLKQQLDLQAFELVAYSGGAAIAVILAAERDDIKNLRTVAGNLDTEYVNEIHHVSAMPASLNPQRFASQLNIPQLHFVGADDGVIPDKVAKKFASVNGCAKVVMVKNANHWQGWQTQWVTLLQTTLPVCH